MKKGFNFDNFRRNEMLQKMGYKLPKVKKTGTTIVGLVFKDGVILGADTRATEGPIIADKNCKKIHHLAPNIYCCGAGTSADTESVTGMIASQLTLLRYDSGKPSRVLGACTLLKRRLFRYQGYISAALVLGGVDVTGPHIYMVYPHGSTSNLPFATMGSGSLHAMSMFESEYKQNMEEKEAVALVHKAVCAGIYNDLGSGSNVDICVIKKDHVHFIRGFDASNQRKLRRSYNLPNGTTPFLAEKIEFFKKKVVVEEVKKDDDKMDLD